MVAPNAAGCFWLRLTSRSVVQTGTNQQGSDMEGLAERRVFLVEDEMLLALMIQYSLAEAGAQTIGPASRLADALAIASNPEERMDAAILDVDLHGQNVFPVADALQERGVPFLFHTGHGTKAELTGRYTEVVVCSKPTLPEDLIAALAGLLN